jgi:hypothetical protein
MSGPAYVDWPIWAGNTESRRVQITDNGGADAVDLTGSVIILTVTWAGGSFVARSDAGDGVVSILDQTDALTKGWFRIVLSPAQTRLFPLGADIRYEIERQWSGMERSYLTGMMIPETENNEDG